LSDHHGAAPPADAGGPAVPARRGLCVSLLLTTAPN
jgi:hypothetical protein